MTKLKNNWKWLLETPEALAETPWLRRIVINRLLHLLQWVNSRPRAARAHLGHLVTILLNWLQSFQEESG